MMAKLCIHYVVLATTLGMLALCRSTHGTGVSLWLNSVEYQNHSIVYADDINTYYDSDSRALQCRTDNPDCCSSSTGGYWYLPSGSAVLTEYQYYYGYYDYYYGVYQSRGGSSQQLAAVYLHRTSSSVTEGLYRCEIPTNGTHGDIEVAYVGVYWQSSSSGTPTISEDLRFTRDEEGIYRPWANPSPVFTLTCNSGDGPATTVTWKRDGTNVSEDSYHVMTRRVLDQSGPNYTSTLTVTGREDGLYTFTVTNDMGSADGQYQVEAASQPLNFFASQVGTTTIRILWNQPNSGATPTGSIIYVHRRYYSQGRWSYVYANVQSGYNKYLLENRRIGYHYRLRMRTRSHQLPSAITSSAYVTMVPGAPTITTISPSSTSVHVYWQQVDGANTYEISFERLTGSQQLLCTDYGHSGSYSVGSGYSSYTLTGLQEYSVYSISLVAVTSNDVRSSSTTRQVTTMSAAPISAPQNLQTIATDETSITVQWDAVACIDRNSEITGYKLRYTGYEEAIPQSGDVGGTSTITGLSPLTSYSIEVAAVSDSGIGPFASIIVRTPLYAPDGLRPVIANTDATNISLSWDWQSYLDLYRISFERVTGGQQVLCPDVSHTGMEIVDGSSTEYTVRDLQEYSIYSITVTAVNTAGETSSTVTATTLQAAPSGTPQGLNTTDVSFRNVTVVWTEPVCIDQNSEISHYLLRYKGNEIRVPERDGGHQYSLVITGLSPSTKYYIEVAAVNVHGETGPFAITTVKTLSGDEVKDSASVTYILSGMTILVVLLAVMALVLIGILKMASLLRKQNNQTPNSKEETEMDVLKMPTNECPAYGVAPPLQNQRNQPEDNNVYELVYDV